MAPIDPVVVMRIPTMLVGIVVFCILTVQLHWLGNISTRQIFLAVAGISIVGVNVVCLFFASIHCPAVMTRCTGPVGDIQYDIQVGFLDAEWSNPELMSVHKQSLHEPRTKSPSRRYEERDPVEERMDTEDSVSYTIQSHDMMNIPVSSSFSRSRSLTAIHNNVCISKSSAPAHFIPFSHACYIKHQIRLTLDGLTGIAPPLPTFTNSFTAAFE